MKTEKPMEHGPVESGLEFVRRHGVKCAIGKTNRYEWRHRLVVLTSAVAMGRDMRSRLIAAHEVAHSFQPRWWWPFRIFVPFRWWMEHDAWMRVVGGG